MGGKAADLNSVLENQDSDLHQQVAFSDTTDTIHAFYVQISNGRQGFVPPLKFRRGQELILPQFWPQTRPERGGKRPGNASRNRR